MSQLKGKISLPAALSLSTASQFREVKLSRHTTYHVTNTIGHSYINGYYSPLPPQSENRPPRNEQEWSLFWICRSQECSHTFMVLGFWFLFCFLFLSGSSSIFLPPSCNTGSLELCLAQPMNTKL